MDPRRSSLVQLCAGLGALALGGCGPQQPASVGASTAGAATAQAISEAPRSASPAAPRRSATVSSEQRDAAAEVVLRAAWGGEVADLGRRQADESAPEGPMSFAVDDDGTLYLLDQVNQRVQLFKGGAHLRSIPLSADTFQDLGLLDGDRLLLLDRLVRRELVFVRRSDGRELASVPIEGPGLPEGGAVTGLFVRPDGVWLEHLHTSLVHVATLDGQAAPQRAVLPGRFAHDGKTLLQAARDGDDAALLWRRDLTGADTTGGMSQVRFELPLLYLFALASDAQGRIYLGAHLARFAGAPHFEVVDEREEVVVLGPDGRLRGRVALMPNTGPEELFVSLRVAADGCLYHLVADDLGVTVWRYAP